MMKHILRFLLLFVIIGIGFSFYYFSNEDRFLKVDPILEEKEFSDNFYYNNLNNKAKKYYSMIYDASLNDEDNFTYYFKYNETDLYDAILAFEKDYPLYSYWNVASNTMIKLFKTSTTMKLNDEYDLLKENVDNIENKAKQIVAECLSDNQYQTILNVHDYLIDNISYNADASNAHNLIGPLLDGECVCEGYAIAFKYLMDLLDYDCITVIGDIISSGEHHAWNLIQIDNLWYAVDVTWDDGDIGSYVYFLADDEIIDFDHSKDDKYDYPKCNDNSLFLIDDAYMISKDGNKDEIKNFIKTELKNRYKDFYMFFSNSEDCNKIKEWLFSDENFINIYKSALPLDQTIYYGCKQSNNLIHLFYHY